MKTIVKAALTVPLSLVGAAAVWHVAVAQSFHGLTASAPGATLTIVSVNPLTNEVNAISQAAPSVTDAAAVSTTLEPAVEEHLNDTARDRLDLYAMLIPYRATVAVHLEPEDRA